MKKLIATLTLTMLAVVLLAQQENSTPSTIYAEVKWDKTAFDFGRVEANKPVTYTFKFTNIGTVPLQIFSVERGCNCTVSEYPIAPIPVGGTGSVKVEYDAKMIGQFSKVIKVKMNTAISLNELFISGTVIEKTIN